MHAPVDLRLVNVRDLRPLVSLPPKYTELTSQRRNYTM